MLRIDRHVSKVPTAEVTWFSINPSAWADKPPDQKLVPGIKQNTESPRPSFKVQGQPPAAEVATAVRALVIMLDFRRRNDGPVAVTADFAGNPITVFNPRFCRRTVFVVATWHGAIVWHHPGGIKPLMDGLIFRWMVMLLRYGGAGSENEAARGHTSSRTRNTGGEIPASHGGPAKNAHNPMPGNLTLCECKTTPNINNRVARSYAKSALGQKRPFDPLSTTSGLPR